MPGDRSKTYLAGSRKRFRRCQTTQQWSELTADNLFPDGEFVESLFSSFRQSGGPYFGTRSPIDGLPYGVSGEVFTAGILREAAAKATIAADREHVTPWIVRKCAPALPDLRQWCGGTDLSHLRCTIDNLDDYCRVGRVFSAARDPIKTPWPELCRLLQSQDAISSRLPWTRIGREVHGAMTLGGAQLGMPYGVANCTGQPSDAETDRILERAVAHGVTMVDVARVYGVAERRVGRFLRRGYDGQLRVVTKLDPLARLSADANEDEIRAAVDASVFRSCAELGQLRLDTLLLHRWDHRHSHRGAIWRRLKYLQAEGIIEKLGASIYTPEEALDALRDSAIAHIQLPYNLLDWRWDAAGISEAARRRLGLVIHVRSSLLQGLLLVPAERWPSVAGVDAARIGEKLDEMVQLFGRESRMDLCLAYVRTQPWVTSLVLGMETAAQLENNCDLFDKPSLTLDQCTIIRKEFGRVDERLLDPSRWAEAS